MQRSFCSRYRGANTKEILLTNEIIWLNKILYLCSPVIWCVVWNSLSGASWHRRGNGHVLSPAVTHRLRNHLITPNFSWLRRKFTISLQWGCHHLLRGLLFLLSLLQTRPSAKSENLGQTCGTDTGRTPKIPCTSSLDCDSINRQWRILTSWSKAFFEKLTISLVGKKFPAIYKTQRFTIMLSTEILLSLSWARLTL